MMMEALHTESEPKPLGTVRVECPYPVLTYALKEMLKDEAHLVYEGRKPRGAQKPSCVLLCPNGKDVAPEVRRIKTFMPDGAIVVFAVHMDPRLAQSALRAGASGFIHAGMRPEQIVRAIRLACAGEIVVSQTTLSKGLLENMVAEEVPEELVGTLTPRQREILELVSKGLSNAQIAERLFLTESTIKQHLYATYKLLHVRNRIQAAKLLQGA